MSVSAPVWVALLRGINVGASHRMTMVDLRAVIEGAGGTGVTTHIQSGNVLLNHGISDRAALAVILQEALHERFGYPVPVVLRTGPELASLIAGCRFTGQDRGEDRRRYVTFLTAPPEPERVRALLGRATEGESLYVTDTEVCAAVRKDSAKPAYADIDRILKVSATTRAWNVVERLAVLAARE